jgi:hypothetical protein
MHTPGSGSSSGPNTISWRTATFMTTRINRSVAITKYQQRFTAGVLLGALLWGKGQISVACLLLAVRGSTARNDSAICPTCHAHSRGRSQVCPALVAVRRRKVPPRRATKRRPFRAFLQLFIHEPCIADIFTIDGCTDVLTITCRQDCIYHCFSTLDPYCLRLGMAGLSNRAMNFRAWTLVSRLGNTLSRQHFSVIDSEKYGFA